MNNQSNVGNTKEAALEAYIQGFGAAAKSHGFSDEDTFALLKRAFEQTDAIVQAIQQNPEMLTQILQANPELAAQLAAATEQQAGAQPNQNAPEMFKSVPQNAVAQAPAANAGQPA